jgi:hypothetical protein
MFGAAVATRSERFSLHVCSLNRVLFLKKLALLHDYLLMLVNLLKRMELLLKGIKIKKEKSMAACFKPAQPQVRASYQCDCFDEQCQVQTCH